VLLEGLMPFSLFLGAVKRDVVKVGSGALLKGKLRSDWFSLHTPSENGFMLRGRAVEALCTAINSNVRLAVTDFE
jgi:hypothetical protein